MLPDNLKELASYRQWIVRAENKIPLNPVNLTEARVNDPETWTDYGTAVKVCASNPQLGLGFVFTEADPFVGIDLDNPNDSEAVIESHKEILSQFPTYSEYSPSNTGVHLLVRGKLPDAGGKNSALKLEIYQSGRYFTITGNVCIDLPIADCNGTLTKVYTEKIRSKVQPKLTIEDQPETESDSTIIERASTARNGELFDQLWRGDFNNKYPSQSEADIALVDIISFYTDNRQQAGRIFRSSALGQRDKAKRDDYLFHPRFGIVSKSFDRKLPPPQFSGIQITPTEIVEPEVEIRTDWQLPRGLLGEIALFIYKQAKIPCEEVALAGAIALMAGIAGRQYNISDTGLNQYIILLAGTGTGKEGAATGISTLLNSLNILVNRNDIIGPSLIPSSQGLIKHLAEHPCCVSLLGEVGYWLQSLTNRFARPNEIAIRRALLDLYGKSGANSIMEGSSYSNKQDNYKAFSSPAFSLFGESTQQEFYKSLDESNIADGLIPRFTVIEYNGPLPEYAPFGVNVKPSIELSKRLSDFCARTQSAARSNNVIKIQMTPLAEKLSLEYRAKCRQAMMEEPSEALKELYNRSHLKVLRMAGLLAVGINEMLPMVDAPEIKWAITFIEHGTKALLKRFRSGEVGEVNLSNEQLKAMTNFVQKYAHAIITNSFDVRRMNVAGVDKAMLMDGMISNKYLQSMLKGIAAFRKDRDSNRAFNNTLAELLSAGILTKASNAQLIKHNKKGGWYVITDHT